MVYQVVPPLAVEELRRQLVTGGERVGPASAPALTLAQGPLPLLTALTSTHRLSATLRRISLQVGNAGSSPVRITHIHTDAHWLAVPAAVELRNEGALTDVHFPLLPGPFAPGKHRAAITLQWHGAGAHRVRQGQLVHEAQLIVPSGPVVWFAAPRLKLSGVWPKRSVIIWASSPVTIEADGGQIARASRQVELYPGRYTLHPTDGGPAVLGFPESDEPKRMLTEPTKLTIPGPTADCELWNLGGSGIRLRLQADRPWLQVRPQEVFLKAGQQARISVGVAEEGATWWDQEGSIKACDESGKAVADLSVHRAFSLHGGLLRIVSASAAPPRVALGSHPSIAVTVANVGTHTATLQLDNPLSLAPGRQASVDLNLPCPDRPGIHRVSAVIPTDAPLPAHRHLRVETTLQVVQSSLLKPVLDFGTILAGSSASHMVTVRRTDHRPPLLSFDIPRRWRWSLKPHGNELRFKATGEESGHVRIPVGVVDEAPGGGPLGMVEVRAFVLTPRLPRIWLRLKFHMVAHRPHDLSLPIPAGLTLYEVRCDTTWVQAEWNDGELHLHLEPPPHILPGPCSIPIWIRSNDAVLPERTIRLQAEVLA